MVHIRSGNDQPSLHDDVPATPGGVAGDMLRVSIASLFDGPSAASGFDAGNDSEILIPVGGRGMIHDLQSSESFAGVVLDYGLANAGPVAPAASMPLDAILLHDVTDPSDQVPVASLVVPGAVSGFDGGFNEGTGHILFLPEATGDQGGPVAAAQSELSHTIFDFTDAAGAGHSLQGAFAVAVDSDAVGVGILGDGMSGSRMPIADNHLLG